MGRQTDAIDPTARDSPERTDGLFQIMSCCMDIEIDHNCKVVFIHTLQQ